MRHQTLPADQLALFEMPVFLPKESTPGGFLYKEDFLSVAEEKELLEIFKTLPFTHDTFNGYEAFRRTVGYGWTSRPELPDFIVPLRDRAAAFAGIDPATLDSALISEYTPGAAIGWHRDKTSDKSVKGHVVGVSLAAGCHFRLRRARWSGPKPGGEIVGYDRFGVIAEPRSVYCMRGESWSRWQHSIPRVEALRYSITFRDF
ncbi:MAG TPA: alpha-ketoglutarate-dependent dioxygenase AlkB [Alphaproteobacteria bacterium]|nr:alpha-ketoglutarate-dependent dioxygenase AlkB [Alphaproteobacteria bacterium]